MGNLFTTSSTSVAEVNRLKAVYENFKKNEANYDVGYVQRVNHSSGALHGCRNVSECFHGVEFRDYVEVGSTFDAFRKLLDNPVFAKPSK